MPILSGHSHPRNLCILPRRISYALVEQVQQERIFYPFVCTPEAWEVTEPEGFLLPLDAGHGGQSLQKLFGILEMTIYQSSLGISFGL